MNIAPEFILLRNYLVWRAQNLYQLGCWKPRAGMEKEEAWAEWSPLTGMAVECGREACREAEGAEGMRSTAGRLLGELPWRQEKEESTRDPTCLNHCQGPWSLHLPKPFTQNHPISHVPPLAAPLPSLPESLKASFTHLRASCIIPNPTCPPGHQSSVFCLFSASKAPKKTSVHIKVT